MSEGRTITEREALRRFHLGDTGALAGPLPEGLLPAALAALRGTRVDGGWPLLVEPDPACGPFARGALDLFATGAEEAGEPCPTAELVRWLADRVGTGEKAARPLLDAAALELEARPEIDQPACRALVERLRGAALAASAQARFVGPDPEVGFALARAAAERAGRRARQQFDEVVRRAAVGARERLSLERDRAGADPSLSLERLGALGALFVDGAKLHEIAARRRESAEFGRDRGARVDLALEVVDTKALPASDAHWFVPRGFDARGFGDKVRAVEDPATSGVRAFDRLAAEVAGVVRSARTLALELADGFDPERHGLWLDRLDWRGFSASELALVPTVFVVLRASDLAAGDLAAVSRILTSGRPIQVFVVDDEPGARGEPHLDVALVGMAHRGAFVHQGSRALPAALAAGFERAFASGRPSLHVLGATAPETAGLDPWLIAAARVAARAQPVLCFDPGASDGWSGRVDLSGNPALDRDWGGDPLTVGGNGASSRELGGGPFTFADLALLDPRWSGELAVATGHEDELTDFDAWLELSADAALRRLPRIFAVDGEGRKLSLVVSRALAFAARDRLDLWRALRTFVTPTAVTAEVADAAAPAPASVVPASAAPAPSEPAPPPAGVDLGALALGLVDSLLRLGGGEGLVAPSGAETSGQAPAAAPVPAAGEASATPSVSPTAPAVAEAAWIDTALCTSCDECVRKFPAVFAYDANKQAYVKDPRGGRFRDLVAAAAACSARVIHPGAPWDPSEPDLAKWVEKAKAYQ